MTKQALRVLYISPNAALGGAERVVMDLLALHNRAQVWPSVVFLHDGPLVAVCRDELQVPTHVIPAPPLRKYFSARRTVKTLAELIEAEKIDLVHNTMAWGHIYGGRAAARARRPAVWFQHVGASRSSWVEVWAAWVRTRAIIANSEFTARRQHALNPRRAPVEVIYPGTRIPDEPFDLRRSRARVALDIGDGDFAVGIAARLQRGKGQEVVIRAAASLLHGRSHARLYIIGDALFGLEPEFASSLRSLVHSLGIEDRVFFTGHRDDLPGLIAGLDVAVHASTTPEPFGLGLIEAMAQGVPLIAADAGAAREIVTPGVDGLLTVPGDHEALATAMLALCDDEGRRRRMAQAGMRTARERFDARRMTRKVEQLYKTLLQQ